MKSRKLLIGFLTFMFAAGLFITSTFSTYGQSALGLNWTSLGPDNYSGRTRALLLSNKDAQFNTLYAGGVSGGLWKSTTKGLTWNQINTDNVVLNVSCIAQSPTGDIYVGTGESFASERFNLYSGFIGQGIYKSTDGNTFTKLASTDPGSFNNPNAEWAFVNRIAAVDGKVYAATNSGLKVSTDGGTTWTTAMAGDVELNSPSTEVELASDGTVVASVDNVIYLSSNGASNSFVKISGDEGDNELPEGGLARIELAFAPTDVNTLYAVLIADGTSGGFLRGQLRGVYVSKDKGETWRLIGPGASVLFNVFGDAANTTHYGDYAASLIVDAENPDMIYLGGVNIWEGTKVLETGFYQWQQKTGGNVNRFHNMVIDPQNNIYLATDQGVFKSTTLFNEISGLNRNYRTSMFYTVAFNDNGKVIGGTQGNGVVFIDGLGNTPAAGHQIFTGNVGGSVEISMINPKALFWSSNNGYYERSADLGVSVANEFVLSDISTANGSLFQTPFRMWESFDFQVSRDSITYITKVDHQAGETITVNSKTSGFPFEYTFTQPLLKGDSVKIQDIIASRFFIGAVNAVYMSKEVLDFSKLPKWFKIANIEGNPTSMAYSSDVNYLYVGTQEGKVYRISNIALANDSIRAEVTSSSQIISTTLIQTFEGRNVTSIAVDPSDAKNVLVTLGGYGNDNFVYYSTNALDLAPTFATVQGNLPKMPVYSSLFEMTSSDVIIGTDFGIYTTKALGANTKWTAENSGMGALPIFAIRQQTASRPYVEGLGTITNKGAIYIASHGNGIFENRLYVGMDDGIGNKPSTINNQIVVYPNPVSDQINLKVQTSKATNSVANIYDLRGNLISTHNLGILSKGVNKVEIPGMNLSAGTYLIQLISGTEVQRAKFVVVK
jgi:hypothetical protein